MKKIFVGAVALFLMVMISCNGASEKAREDSIRIADSIAQVEAAKAAAEKARLDSIRQDSIKNAEEFAQVVKALEHLPSDVSSVEGFLKSLGFKGSKKTSTRTEVRQDIDFPVDLPVEEYYYIYTKGGKSIKYYMYFFDTPSYGNCTQKITVEGDGDALDNLYRYFKRHYDSVSKRGNTIVIEEGWA